ncbi:hypothetical protein Q4555_15855 [Octadecabacter sp. 1_MG-2023]|uniref:hypothetical protein n=1 Tax=unclassified Octadecabacter TaxID=196158 RepID=UPI001C09206C|nr:MULTISPECIES: hypothetical protein [unclassified Octadecabacter]MBU2991626.1 hypothetical protein [Octadecabacter sp. B2R22]MDO6736153.1 hypothetical protein [Octadecabacter sp. 1_MG-2023]
MTVPSKYLNLHIPAKDMVNSHRAFSDGKYAASKLRRIMEQDSLLLRDWKIHWVASCTLLRTAIDLFKADAKNCLSHSLREEFRNEWHKISDDRDQHPIFWKFLREERNNIIHEYRWSAYERYFDAESGETASPPGLLTLTSENYGSELKIRTGHFEGQSALGVIDEATGWVRARIMAVFERANIDPDERRNVVTFTVEPKRDGLLGNLLQETKED